MKTLHQFRADIARITHMELVTPIDTHIIVNDKEERLGDFKVRCGFKHTRKTRSTELYVKGISITLYELEDCEEEYLYVNKSCLGYDVRYYLDTSPGVDLDHVLEVVKYTQDQWYNEDIARSWGIDNLESKYNELLTINIKELVDECDVSRRWSSSYNSVYFFRISKMYISLFDIEDIESTEDSYTKDIQLALWHRHVSESVSPSESTLNLIYKLS